MTPPNDLETFWLTATNITLGVVTLVCIAMFFSGLFADLKARFATRRAMASVGVDDHAFAIHSLGITMADGGERLDKKSKDGLKNSDK
jgi:hypothetical protein